MSEWIRKEMIFLTSWPSGRLRMVTTLGRHPSIRGGIYIEYLDGKGGTDTTTKDFLFEPPKTNKRD